MRALLLVPLAGCLLLLLGCRSQYHQAIIGEWQDRGNSLSIEFNRSGTFKLAGPRGAIIGTYSTTFRDDLHLIVDKQESGWALRVSPYGTGLGGSDSRTGTLVFEYKLALSPDQNTLTMTDSKGGAMTFQRLR